MLDWLATLLKAACYGATLSGAGVALAGLTLRTSALGDYARGASRLAGLTLALSALASAILLVVRLGGYWDWATLADIFETPLGGALALQFSGGLWLARGPGRIESVLPAIMAVLAFSVSGHAPAKNLALGLLVSLHVAAAAWWVGSLWLLRRACRDWDAVYLAPLVRRFSLQAVWIVAGLGMAGFMIAATLLRFSVDLERSYDRVLLLKLILVLALLMLAALNKFALTPHLTAEPGAGRVLRRSIDIEMACFGLIALTTAFLTTFTSPHESGEHYGAMSAGM
jgi:copper transport protein